MDQSFDAITHLDAGHDAELLDEVDEGSAGVGLLEEGLVEEDDAGDALQLRLGDREEELPECVRGFIRIRLVQGKGKDPEKGTLLFLSSEPG